MNENKAEGKPEKLAPKPEWGKWTRHDGVTWESEKERVADIADLECGNGSDGTAHGEYFSLVFDKKNSEIVVLCNACNGRTVICLKVAKGGA